MRWQIPSTRQDGQPLLLSELAGYEIYYVPDSTGAPDTTISISGGSATSYSLANLAAGTYSFAISAIDSTGAKSALSGVVVLKVGP